MATIYVEDTSELSSLLSSPLSSPPNSPILPPSWPTQSPLPSQEHVEDGMAPAPKRRKTEPKIRTSQHLDLTSETSQSDYDRKTSLKILLKALRKRRKIVVVAGAGISVSAGIPDFRSSHGLFETLRSEHKLRTSGKELFNASVYKDDSSTSMFHDMVRDLSKMAADAEPTAFHLLLARLAEEGRLLRLYTQNIDGIDASLPPLATKVPLPHQKPWPKTIQLHGGLNKMLCQKCHHTSDFQPQLFQGPKPPLCPECTEKDSLRTTHAGKRSHGIGKLRPRIVLYDEHNPDAEAIGAVSESDLKHRPDAIIVVGTSMKIPGVKRLVREMCGVVRSRRDGISIWINPDPVPPGKDFDDCWDLVVKGDCDEVARQANLKDLEEQRPDTPPQEYTMSDVERVKAKQGPISVVIPVTPKKSKKLVVNVSGIMTPPVSMDEELSDHGSIRVATAGIGSVPPKTNTVKNPASLGRSISDVLGHKAAATKRVGRPRGSVNRKPPKKSGKNASQAVILGKVSKPAAKAKTSKSGLKSAAFPDLPSQVQNLPPSSFSSVTARQSSEPVDIAYAPESLSQQNWGNRDTISPTGSIPSGMADLLDVA